MLSVGQAHAEPMSLRAAVQDMHDADAHGQLFSMSIAVVGLTPGTVLGSWALLDREGLGLGALSPLSSASALILVFSGGGLLAHGILRTTERQASAYTSARLLADDALLESSGMLYLQDRAHKARTTRFWGGSLTCLHGAGLVGMGISEVLADDGSAGLGYTALGVGVAAIGIGAVHFFGKPRAGRVLSRVQPTVSQARAGQGVRAGLSWIGAF